MSVDNEVKLDNSDIYKDIVSKGLDDIHKDISIKGLDDNEKKFVVLNCRDEKIRVPLHIAMKMPNVASAIKHGFDLSDGYYINHDKKDVWKLVDELEMPLKLELGFIAESSKFIPLISEKEVEIALYKNVSLGNMKYEPAYYMTISTKNREGLLSRIDSHPFKITLFGSSVISAPSDTGIYKISIETTENYYYYDPYLRMISILCRSKYSFDVAPEDRLLPESYETKHKHLAKIIIKELNGIVSKHNAAME